MFYLTSTYTDQLSQSIAEAIGALFELAAILLIIKLGMLILIVALITWVVKKVWYAGSNRKQKHKKKKTKKIQGYKNYKGDTWYPDGTYYNSEKGELERPNYRK